MKKVFNTILMVIFTLVVFSCGDDDDSGIIPERDRAEVDLEDQEALNAYLQTHFWNYEEYASITPGEEFSVQIDTIEGNNSTKIPLINQVTSSTLSRNDIDYTIYTLKVRQGGGTTTPSFADSVLVSYKGYRLDRVVFDSSINAVWFDLPTVVAGFMEGVTGFNGASSLSQNADGTISYVDSGIGAVFMPSGVGYFSSIQSDIPAYSPLVFTFEVRDVKVTDHDGDGILSKFEDLNNDRNLRSSGNFDNTDEDLLGGFNYLDVDDDGDGILTSEENADPNGDGNPDDALDSDGDGIPDYLDPDSQ